MQSNLIAWLYRALGAIFSPFLLVYVLWRCARNRAYLDGIGERFGFLQTTVSRTVPGGVWLHAVSVGEVLSAVELIRRLRAGLPWAPVYVSSTTLAGRALAREKLGGLAAAVFYAPFDFAWAVRALLRRLRPSVVVVLETEIWPNLFRETKRAGCGLLVVNGRISDRARSRYSRLRWFFRGVLAEPDLILVQSAQDRDRYLATGAQAARTRVGGNLKYDFQPKSAAVPDAVAALLERARPERVWIAASTVAPEYAGDVDEDDAVLDAFLRLSASHPRLLLAIAPRKPERFDAVAAKCQAAGVRWVRRSRLPAGLELPGVLLLDSIGELAGLFARADAVFMGGTLADRGGHNILEPAFFARPLIVGPHLENFAAIAEAFRAGGGLLEINAPGELADAVERLLRDPAQAALLGQRAAALAEGQRGAVDRAVAEIARLADSAVPNPPRKLPARWALAPLAVLWRAGTAWKRSRTDPRRLETPVISVGGISVGGSGKTPLVRWLAAKLAGQGSTVAILTRGYRRESRGDVVVAAGSRAAVTDTGDEAQLYLRSGHAIVGIGADRHRVGSRIEREHHPAVFLLDDGFQHWRLARTLDIVAIDTLDPFGGFAVLPLGRLREPLAALARADVFVLQRADFSREYRGIERELRRHNPRAPIFRSRVVAECWVSAASGATVAPEYFRGKMARAFCGLANPDSFRATLARLGVRGALAVFPDHHRYSAAELERLARSGDTLLTTEKDLANLPPERIPPGLWSLAIGIEIDREAEFMAVLAAACGVPSAAPRP